VIYSKRGLVEQRVSDPRLAMAGYNTPLKRLIRQTVAEITLRDGQPPTRGELAQVMGVRIDTAEKAARRAGVTLRRKVQVRTRPSPLEESERNRALLLFREGGWSYARLGREFSITRQRVQQICANAARKARVA
jgi:hypothetical protein